VVEQGEETGRRESERVKNQCRHCSQKQGGGGGGILEEGHLLIGEFSSSITLKGSHRK